MVTVGCSAALAHATVLSHRGSPGSRARGLRSRASASSRSTRAIRPPRCVAHEGDRGRDGRAVEAAFGPRTLAYILWPARGGPRRARRPCARPRRSAACRQWARLQGLICRRYLVRRQLVSWQWPVPRPQAEGLLLGRRPGEGRLGRRRPHHGFGRGFKVGKERSAADGGRDVKPARGRGSAVAVVAGHAARAAFAGVTTSVSQRGLRTAADAADPGQDGHSLPAKPVAQKLFRARQGCCSRRAEARRQRDRLRSAHDGGGRRDRRRRPGSRRSRAVERRRRRLGHPRATSAQLGCPHQYAALTRLPPARQRGGSRAPGRLRDAQARASTAPGPDPRKLTPNRTATRSLRSTARCG